MGEISCTAGGSLSRLEMRQIGWGSCGEMCFSTATKVDRQMYFISHKKLRKQKCLAFIKKSYGIFWVLVGKLKFEHFLDVEK